MFKSLLQVYLLLQALCSWREGHTRVARSFDGSRVARYAEYDPPIILPEKNEQIVMAGQDYKLTCEGSRGVNWRIPAQEPGSGSDLRERLRLRYSRNEGISRQSRGDVYVAEMTIRDLTYTDTGTFTCTY